MTKKKQHQQEFFIKHPLLRKLLRILAWIVVSIVVIITLLYIAFQVSPWPSALLVRSAFDKGSRQVSQALEKYVPSTVDSMLDQQYKAGDKDAYLDVYYPHGIGKPMPTIIWVHGGGWISGDKKNVGNYLKILANKGYTAISIGYSIAPEKHYPTPVIQTNEALGYINENAQRLHVDPQQIVLAGDSAGSQIAAQVAALTTNSAYALDLGMTPSLAPGQLAGMLLNCGAYDISIANPNRKDEGAKLLRTFLWAYSGKKDFMNDSELMKASVVNYATKAFPPSFITAGNNDPLLEQSQVFAKKLSSLGVQVDALFYPADYAPALQHEYQFNLDIPAGQLALSHMERFLAAHTHR